MRALISIVTVMALVLAWPAQAQKGSTRVGWQGKSYLLERLPGELPDQARAAVEAWSPWVARSDYRMDLDRSARVLLISKHTRSRARSELELIERTGETFDELLPAVGAGDEWPPLQGAGVASETDEIPEDPEQAPLGLGGPDPDERTTAEHPGETTWGAATFEPDTQTAVMLVLHDEEDYAGALAFLAEQQPYLEAWVAEARAHTGFAIELPLCGAYVENASGQEEWDPDNELVHRVMRLLTLRRFGQQPYWLAVGLSWHAELTVRGTIYCFPYRNGFVGVGEHGGWGNALRSAFKDKGARPLEMSELAAWRPGTYDDRKAMLAWGMVDFMAGRHAASCSALLEDLRVFRDQDNRQGTGGGTWQRRRDYEIPAETQRALFARHLGEGFLGEAAEYWRGGAKAAAAERSKRR